jgi:hypothetical protein
MKTAEVLKQIRKHSGPVVVGVLARDDVFYVKVVKTDLLEQLANLADDQVEVRVKNGTLHVDNFTG